MFRTLYHSLRFNYPRVSCHTVWDLCAGTLISILISRRAADQRSRATEHSIGGSVY